MVRGLAQFRDHFRGFSDRYVVIGGTACDLLMTAAGLPYRRTRDLDIVLVVEALDSAFAAALWSFVERGGYPRRFVGTGKRSCYRFESPVSGEFPEMIELFTRHPDARVVPEGVHLARIPIPDSALSLSAILLRDDYYRWLLEGRVELDGVPLVGAAHLIPMKARAWLDLSTRATEGAKVDSADIRKHRNDVFRLLQLIVPNDRFVLPATLNADMRQFGAEIGRDPPDLRALGINSLSMESALELLRALYDL